MKTPVLPHPVNATAPSRRGVQPVPAKAALAEAELAIRWGMSPKTLRRWRQHHQGPVYCKLGSRVVYLLTEVEAFERRCSRFSTFARASV
jgi:hypothetical protein